MIPKKEKLTNISLKCISMTQKYLIIFFQRMQSEVYLITRNHFKLSDTILNPSILDDAYYGLLNVSTLGP